MRRATKTSDRTPEEVEGKLPKSTESWERLTRLELVVQQLVRDYEKMDTRIDDISKTQDKITGLIKNTRNIVLGAFGAMILQVPELIKFLPDILKLMSAS